MAASFGAEVLKLGKRPATWMIGLLFVVTTLLFGYLFSYVFVVNAAAGGGLPQEARDGVLQFLIPESVLGNVLSTFASFGSALALVLGALAMGSEYGWDTFKVILTQRPGRLGFLAGKLLAAGVALLAITVVILAAGAAASYLIAGVEDATVEWPSLWEIIKGIGAGWLILATFAALGVLLATLLRGTALAIGIGLVYLLVLESLFTGLASQNETVADIAGRLPAKNSLDLAGAFGQAPPGFGAPGETVEPTTATITLGIYAVVFLTLVFALFKKRDQS